MPAAPAEPARAPRLACTAAWGACTLHGVLLRLQVVWSEEYGQYGAWALDADGNYLWYPAQVCSPTNSAASSSLS